MSWWKDAIGWEDKPKNQNIGDLLDVQPDQNRITIIGTIGSGKSAYLAGTLITADRKVSKSRGTDHPFRYYLREGSGNIEHDKSALRAGHFPPKTGALKMSSIEQRVTFEWAHVRYVAGKEITLSKRQADMPICDLAGEDLCQLIEKVNQTRTLQGAALITEQRVLNIVTQSAGLVIIIKATRAQGLGVELEKEPTTIDGLSIYSDANYKRMIDGIVKFKRLNPNSPPLRGVAIVVTAWDGLAPVAEKISLITNKKFDPLDTKISQESLDKFLYMCYPSTHAALTSLHIKNIRYFPSFFEIEKDSNGRPVCWEGTTSPKIMRKEIFDPKQNFEDNVNSIETSEFWFDKFIDWQQEFATLG
jgi:hypothetical protein